jgi:hypothetical protein
MMMRLLPLLPLLVSLASPVALAATSELPDPDYDAIARGATLVEPGSNYVESLPARLAECTDLARPYANSGGTAYMMNSKTIRVTCLEAMFLKLTELYFHPQIFRQEAPKARLERLRADLSTFYEDLYTGMPECFESPSGRSCGTIFDLMLPYDAYVRFLMHLVESAALLTPDISDVAAWRRAWAEAGSF